MVLFVNRISETLKDCQQKNIGKKIVIVITLHCFHVIVSPNFVPDRNSVVGRSRH